MKGANLAIYVVDQIGEEDALELFKGVDEEDALYIPNDDE